MMCDYCKNKINGQIYTVWVIENNLKSERYICEKCFKKSRSKLWNGVMRLKKILKI